MQPYYFVPWPKNAQLFHQLSHNITPRPLYPRERDPVQILKYKRQEVFRCIIPILFCTIRKGVGTSKHNCLCILFITVTTCFGYCGPSSGHKMYNKENYTVYDRRLWYIFQTFNEIYYNNPTRCSCAQSILFHCSVTLHVSGAFHTHHHEYINCIYSLRYRSYIGAATFL